MKTLLSLFDLSLTWAQPYVDNGWCVCQIDKAFENDMFYADDPTLPKDISTIDTEWMYECIFDNSPTGTVDGILSANPCTWFAQSGSQRWGHYDETGLTQLAVNLVRATMNIVDLCDPDFWAMENPVGRINKLIPCMKEYGPRYFEPFHYGDPYSKKTGLWGKFNFPEPTNIVDPVSSGTSESSLDYYWRVIRKVKFNKYTRAYYRSITPEGFAQAFYNTNH